MREEDVRRMPRCRWCNISNARYVAYHDHEWGVPLHDDSRLFAMLVLETFQAGLSWECVLNKREAFYHAFDNFDVHVIARYDSDKVASLLQDKGIIRNRQKVLAAINNAKIFIQLQAEYGSFDHYIWHFTAGDILYESVKTSSELSDRISNELRHRGMRFVGTTTIYSYLQAIGVINSHEPSCYLYICPSVR